MKQKQTIGIAAVLMLAILGVGMVSAFGFGNGISEENKEELRNAIESNDYETWEEIKASQISQQNFDEAKARHQERAEFREAMQEARESGDYEEMQALKEQYGVGKGMHNKNKNLGECPFSK